MGFIVLVSDDVHNTPNHITRIKMDFNTLFFQSVSYLLMIKIFFVGCIKNYRIITSPIFRKTQYGFINLSIILFVWRKIRYIPY